VTFLAVCFALALAVASIDPVVTFRGFDFVVIPTGALARQREHKVEESAVALALASEIRPGFSPVINRYRSLFPVG
jgi:hypothetical protein